MGAGGRITQTPNFVNEIQKVKSVFIFERWTGRSLDLQMHTYSDNNKKIIIIKEIIYHHV